MENREQQPVDILLNQIREEEGEAFVFDREKIGAEASPSSPLFTNLPVKLLTIFGGIVASGFFLGFLMLAGLYDSHVGMLLVGLLFVVGSVIVVWLKSDTMMETFCVSCNIIGYLLFGVGFSELFDSELWLCLSLAALATGVLVVTANTILNLLAVLVLNGSLAGIIFLYKAFNLMHGYIGLAAALLTYMSLREAELISRGNWLNRVYRPVRIGLILTLVAALVLLVHQQMLSSGITHYWLSGIFLIAALLYVVSKVIRQAAVTDQKLELLLYGCCCLVLAPTVFAPSIPGALLIMVSSFYIGHRTGFGIGLLALLYFIILYYYDLQFTLLAKAGILVLSGSLFIGGYLLLQKYIRSHAE
jgi:hypothetical protein